MPRERSHVDKYLCTVCGHRHSNGWYCKHSIDAKDAIIAALRAELLTANMSATEHQAKYVTMHGRHQGLWRESLLLKDAITRLKAENAGLRERVGRQFALLSAHDDRLRGGCGGGESPLAVELRDGKLTISIGIETLCFAAENCDRFYDGEKDRYVLKVIDKVKFAKDVVLALEHEQEDGSTPISRILDEAFEEAVESGSEGVETDGR